MPVPSPPAHIIRGLRVLALAIALAAPGAAVPASTDDANAAPASEARLAGVRQRIAELAHRLQREVSERDGLAMRLRDSETAAAGLRAELRAIEERASRARSRVAKLHARAGELDQRLTHDLALLAAGIRTGYALGRRDRIKLLLNQQDPTTVSRVLAYHGYFTRARAARVAALRDTLAEAREIEGALAAQTAHLEELRRDKSGAIAALEREREQRRELLAAIDGRIADRSRRLARLRADEKQLAALVEGLRRQLADIPLTLDRSRGFATLAGHLPWPAKGKLRHRFGQRRQGALRWRGVLVGAAAGSPVRAIRRGRVAYADWLRGYGLLLIIDHGDGYMSLYGHNQSLFKQPGDWVEDGEPVAAVGDSGGSARAGLYFEIRRRGKPVDPLRWLAR